MWRSLLLSSTTAPTSPTKETSLCLAVARRALEPVAQTLAKASWDAFDYLALEREGVFLLLTTREGATDALPQTSPFVEPVPASWGVSAHVAGGDAVHEDAGNNKVRATLEKNKAAFMKDPTGLVCVSGNDAHTAMQGLRASLATSSPTTPPAGVFVDVAPRSLTRAVLRELATDPLTTYLPRFVWGGCASVLDLLSLVKDGADVVVSTYAETLTRMGYASQLSRFFAPADSPLQSPGPSKMDARTWGETERASLAPACDCFACARHTRAYVRHLVLCHEMLGDSLLMVHNARALVRLMQLVRVRVDSLDGLVDEMRRVFFDL